MEVVINGPDGAALAIKTSMQAKKSGNFFKD
jgi:hypothetical protein